MVRKAILYNKAEKGGRKPKVVTKELEGKCQNGTVKLANGKYGMHLKVDLSKADNEKVNGFLVS